MFGNPYGFHPAHWAYLEALDLLEYLDHALAGEVGSERAALFARLDRLIGRTESTLARNTPRTRQAARAEARALIEWLRTSRLPAAPCSAAALRVEEIVRSLGEAEHAGPSDLVVCVLDFPPAGDQHADL